MYYIIVRCIFRYVRFANKCGFQYYMIHAFINMSSTKVNFELNYVDLNRLRFLKVSQSLKFGNVDEVIFAHIEKPPLRTYFILLLVQ